MSRLDDPNHDMRDGTCGNCGEDVRWDARDPSAAACEHCGSHS